MFPYILKRFFYFIPTFIVISLITFLLSQMAPGDPVELKLKGGMQSANQQASDKLAGEKAYLDLSEKYGRQLPAFYFSVGSSAVPDTLYKITRKADRENLERLISMYGDWPLISAYYYSVRNLELAVLGLPDDASCFEAKKIIRDNCNVLYINHEDNQIEGIIAQTDAQVNVSVTDSQKVAHKPLAALSGVFEGVKQSYEKVKSNRNSTANYIPALHWYGTGNQYHRWMFGDVPWFGPNTDITKHARGFFMLDFGTSYVDDRQVSSIIRDSLRWTLLLSLIILVLQYLISVPSGVILAVRSNSMFDKVYTIFLFICYSLPVVWIGTLLITFLTSDYYGDKLNLFPPYGLGKVGDEFGFWEKVIDRGYHFILPVFTITLGSFAYMSRQMRGAMLSVIRQDYIRTAFAKGLPPNKVFWKHAFRNSLLPIITIFSSVLPALIGGSVIIEYMYNIPGMGRVSYDAVVQRDYPVLFTILLFSALLTMLGNLLADVLYVMVDPRISFNKKM
jgi:peptide/nickel transport system permease protein